jgi:hypothetical protein
MSTKNLKSEKRMMFIAYSNFWKSHLAEIQNTTMLKTTVERFIQTTERIVVLEPESLIGTRALQEQLTDQLQMKGFEVCQAIFAYASFHHLADLKAVFKKNSSDFNTKEKFDLLDLVKPIHTKALELQTELSELIPIEDIEVLGVKLQELEQTLGQRTQTEIENTATREEIVQLYKEQMETRSLLKALVVNFKKGDTHFHTMHDEARRIHYSKTKKKEQPNPPTNS